MADLLKDNAELERRRLAAGEGGQVPRVGHREVPDFESWLQCFSSYAAVICSKYPQKARELWAYQAMMIAEHRKCGGRGWLLYDRAFRQQIISLERAELTRACTLPHFWPMGGGAMANSALGACHQTICQTSVPSTQSGHCPWCNSRRGRAGERSIQGERGGSEGHAMPGTMAGASSHIASLSMCARSAEESTGNLNAVLVAGRA